MAGIHRQDTVERIHRLAEHCPDLLAVLEHLARSTASLNLLAAPPSSEAGQPDAVREVHRLVHRNDPGVGRGEGERFADRRQRLPEAPRLEVFTGLRQGLLHIRHRAPNGTAV